MNLRIKISILVLTSFLSSFTALNADSDTWRDIGFALKALDETLNGTAPTTSPPATTSGTTPGGSTQTTPGTPQQQQQPTVAPQTAREMDDAKIDFMVSLDQIKEAWGKPTRISNKEHRYEFSNKYGDTCIVYIDRNGKTILHVLKLAEDIEVLNFQTKDFMGPSYPSYSWKDVRYNQQINGQKIDTLNQPYGQYLYVSSHGKYVGKAILDEGYKYRTFIVFDSELYEFMSAEGFNPFSWGSNDPIDEFLYGASTSGYTSTPSSTPNPNSNRRLTPQGSSDDKLKRGEWKISTATGDDIFPSVIVGMSRFSGITKEVDYYGDEMGQIGIEISPVRSGEEITVTVSGTSLIKPSTITARLGKTGVPIKVYPLLEYDYDRLLKLNQPRPETISVTVEQAGHKKTRTKLVHFRSINDCLLLFGVKVDPEDKAMSPDQLFACYVNENHPVIDEILGTALRSRVINSFVGYQGGTADSVDDQVFALWYALQSRGVRYSSITTPSLAGGLPSQHVRFVHETYKNSQANCVDGSVLFCSLLRKIGIKSELIIIPGHCFIAYGLNERGNQKRYLETTAIGSIDLANYTSKEDKIGESILSFINAQELAAQTAQKYLLSSLIRDSGQLIQIDIEKARNNGFMPLPVE